MQEALKYHPQAEEDIEADWALVASESMEERLLMAHVPLDSVRGFSSKISK